jgi:uncharacterized protein with ParB-like and HNH nuclease domain
MENENKIDHDFLGLSSLFGESEGYCRFIVPDYQRGFDWNLSNVEDLWEDLHYYVDREEEGIDEDFFIGTIILKSPSSHLNKSAVKRYEIVDGQQRLTSLYLLALAIRQKFKEFNNEKKYIDVDSKFLNEYDYDDNRTAKLLGTKKIRAVLKYISNLKWDGDFPSKEQMQMDGRTLNPINNKLKKSLKSHQDEINGKGSKETPFDDRRLSLLFKVMQKMKFVVLSVKTDERAFYLFETTNARGKELEPGDLLKNHLFRKFDEAKRDEIYDRWESVIAKSSGKLILMLKHFYYVHDSHVQKKDLYKKLKNLKDEEELLTDIEDYAQFHKLMHKGTREEFIQYFSELEIYESTQGSERYDSIYLSISALRYFKSELTYPVIFGFLKRFSFLLKSDNALKDKNKRKSFKKLFQTTLQALENFQFINYKICSNKGNKIEIPYARFAGNLYKSNTALEFIEELEILYSFLRKNINEQGHFYENFSKISYLDKDKDLIHYIFHKIEEKRLGQALKKKIFKSGVDEIVISIDHWAPQKLSTQSNTQEEFGEYNEIHEAIVTNESQDELIHNIGNLAPMDKVLNGMFSNKIPRKKLEYINENPNPAQYVIHSYLYDFHRILILNPGDSSNKKGDQLSFVKFSEENQRLLRDGKEEAIGENLPWDTECILKRTQELSSECYESIFAVGGASNFPSISSNMLNNFKKSS